MWSKKIRGDFKMSKKTQGKTERGRRREGGKRAQEEEDMRISPIPYFMAIAWYSISDSNYLVSQ